MEHCLLQPSTYEALRRQHVSYNPLSFMYDRPTMILDHFCDKQMIALQEPELFKTLGQLRRIREMDFCRFTLGTPVVALATLEWQYASIPST